MKAILEFNLPEEGEEHEAAVKGMKYKCQVEDIWQVFFRPRHKHGYNDSAINSLLCLNGELDTAESNACNQLMDKLEEIYRAHFFES